MKVTIDRFEGETAVVEIAAGQFATLSRSLLPQAREGDVVNIEIDHDESSRRKRAVEELLSELFED